MLDRLSNTSTSAASNNSKCYVSINFTGQGFKHFYISIHLILIAVVCAGNHYSLQFTNEKTGIQRLKVTCLMSPSL